MDKKYNLELIKKRNCDYLKTKVKIESNKYFERKNKNMKKELNLVISSNNQHKIEEFKEIFKDYPNVTIYSLKDLNINVDPEENGASFKENSLIKANTVAKLTSYAVIADDSGLEIDSLDGFPGIYSSRFMEGHPYKEKFLAIFDKLKDKPRGAQFHCVITLVNLKSDPLFFEGICRGNIALSPSGQEGFGYDPIFVPNGYDSSFAVLGEEIKNKISHRGLASVALINYLKENNYI